MPISKKHSPQAIQPDTARVPHGLEWRYWLGPFAIHSEIEIPELDQTSGTGSHRVNIRLGSVPTSIERAEAFGPACQVSASEYLLEITGVGRFHAANGKEVRLEREATANLSDLSLYLLGSVFGALCHQNGLLPLHASTIQEATGNGPRVTAFLGDSGAGKSTLAAFLQRRGARIVSDDICLLEPAGDGLRIVPIAGWLKLWRESFDQLGEVPDERHRIFSSDEKYRLYLAADPADRPLLNRVIFLTRAKSDDESPALLRLSIAEAIAELMRFTYLAYLVELTGSHERVFRQCAQVMTGATAFRLVVPWGWEHMDAVLALLDR